MKCLGDHGVGEGSWCPSPTWLLSRQPVPGARDLRDATPAPASVAMKGAAGLVDPALGAGASPLVPAPVRMLSVPRRAAFPIRTCGPGRRSDLAAPERFPAKGQPERPTLCLDGHPALVPDRAICERRRDGRRWGVCLSKPPVRRDPPSWMRNVALCGVDAATGPAGRGAQPSWMRSVAAGGIDATVGWLRRGGPAPSLCIAQACGAGTTAGRPARRGPPPSVRAPSARGAGMAARPPRRGSPTASRRTGTRCASRSSEGDRVAWICPRLTIACRVDRRAGELFRVGVGAENRGRDAGVPAD